MLAIGIEALLTDGGKAGQLRISGLYIEKSISGIKGSGNLDIGTGQLAYKASCTAVKVGDKMQPHLFEVLFRVFRALTRARVNLLELK